MLLLLLLRAVTMLCFLLLVCRFLRRLFVLSPSAVHLFLRCPICTGIAIAVAGRTLLAIIGTPDAHLVRQAFFERDMDTGNVFLVEPLDDVVCGEAKEKDENRGEGREE